MKNLITVILFLFAYSLSYNIHAQSISSDSGDVAVTPESVFLPSQGDNFGYSYDDNITANLSYYTLSGDVTTLFFHKGFGDKFGLSTGIVSTDFVNPEVLYLTPSYSFGLADDINVGLELRSAISIDNSEDYIINPQIQVSFGSREKHFTIGYGAVTDFEEFEFFGISDGIYIDAAIKFGGRYAITDNISFLSRNQYYSQSFGTDLSAKAFISRTGADFVFGKLSMQGMVYFRSVSLGQGSNTEVDYMIGASYRF